MRAGNLSRTLEQAQSSNSHSAAVQRFHKVQEIFSKISEQYGIKETQELLIDMLNAGFAIHESAEYLKGVLL